MGRIVFNLQKRKTQTSSALRLLFKFRQKEDIAAHARCCTMEWGPQDDAHALLSAGFHFVILHSSITYCYQHFIQYFCFHTHVASIFKRMQSARYKMTHMDVTPEDRGVTASLFKPTCSLRPPLPSTKLKLRPPPTFLYQVTGPLLSCCHQAKMPVTKPHHSL